MSGGDEPGHRVSGTMKHCDQANPLIRVCRLSAPGQGSIGGGSHPRLSPGALEMGRG